LRLKQKLCILFQKRISQMMKKTHLLVGMLQIKVMAILPTGANGSVSGNYGIAEIELSNYVLNICNPLKHYIRR